jgi:enoyl-CoA hydratase
LIGYARAKEYLLTGDLMTATEAARIGLINHAVPASELDIKVEEFANRLASGAGKSIRWTKASVNMGLKLMVQSVLETSLAYEEMSSKTADHQEAVNAFREKRKPQFQGC